MKKNKFLKFLVMFFSFLLIIAAIVLLYFSIREYKPDDIEGIIPQGTSERKAEISETYNILTFNIGYASLDKDNDFFMDGGENVLGISKEKTTENLKGISEIISNANADVIFLQEVDENSKRSFNINQIEYLKDKIEMTTAFAYNYKCDYVPYPIPSLGKINSGILTASDFKTESASRIALPTPFKWPIRTCNLKRCLLLERIPIKNSNKYLVFVNLHLEAYDDGEGKIAQTNFLTNILKEEYNKGNYVIAGGDFNQTFPKVDLTKGSKYEIKDDSCWTPGKLDNPLEDEGWKLVCDDKTPTCRLLNGSYNPKDEKTQYYVIDGFIISPNIKLNNIETINTDFEFTDHNPVLMQVTLN